MVKRTRLNATFMRTLPVLFKNKYTVETTSHKQFVGHHMRVCVYRAVWVPLLRDAVTRRLCAARFSAHYTIHRTCISFMRINRNTRMLATIYTKPIFFTCASKCPYPVTSSANTGALKLISDCILKNLK